MPTPLRGSTALVTGATAGIGRAVALQLAGAGVRVVAHGRDLQRGAALVEEIEAAGGEGRFLAADLTDAQEVAQLAIDAGDVDVLVNNAGLYELTDTPGTSVESFDRHFALNTRAPFLLVAALVPAMARRGHGRVVNVTSTAATSPASMGGAYGASKAAVELLTRSWAAEFGASGVRVNAVAPGPVRTAGTTAMMGEAVDVLGQANVRGRIGEPEEIAEAVVFLAGPQSSYVNGTVMIVNGGDPGFRPG